MRRLQKKTGWSDDRLERLMGNAASLLADYGMLDGTRGAQPGKAVHGMPCICR